MTAADEIPVNDLEASFTCDLRPCHAFKICVPVLRKTLPAKSRTEWSSCVKLRAKRVRAGFFISSYFRSTCGQEVTL